MRFFTFEFGNIFILVIKIFFTIEGDFYEWEVGSFTIAVEFYTMNFFLH
mgnify:CR=1 FL=1